MTTRYVKDIKRIVGLDKDQADKLPDPSLESRPDLGARRGVGYQEAGSWSIGATENTVGFDENTGATTDEFGNPFNIKGKTNTGTTTKQGEESSKTEKDKVSNQNGEYVSQTGGSSTGGSQKDNTKNTYEQGVGEYQFSDLIDFTNKFPTVDPIKLGADGELVAGAGGNVYKLSGMFDCDTGIEFSLRMDGFFEAPEGWEDPNTPPPLPVEQQKLAGLQWVHRMWNTPDPPSGAQCIQGTRPPKATLQESIEEAAAIFGTSLVSIDAVSLGQPNTCSVPNYVDGALVLATWAGSPDFQVYHHVVLRSCTPDGSVCPSEDDTAGLEEWPEDGKFQLVFQNGVWVSHPFEHPDDQVNRVNDGNHSVLEFCYGDGGVRSGKIQPLRNGGYAIMETTAIGGAPTGVITLIDNSGKVMGYTDALGLNAYLPI